MAVPPRLGLECGRAQGEHSRGKEGPKLAAEPQVRRKGRPKCEGHGDGARAGVPRPCAEGWGSGAAKASPPALRAEKGPEECQDSARCPWTVTSCVTGYGSAPCGGTSWPWSHVGTVLTRSLWAGVLRCWEEARPLSLSVPLAPLYVTWPYWLSVVQRGVQVSEGHRTVRSWSAGVPPSGGGGTASGLVGWATACRQPGGPSPALPRRASAALWGRGLFTNFFPHGHPWAASPRLTPSRLGVPLARPPTPPGPERAGAGRAPMKNLQAQTESPALSPASANRDSAPTSVRLASARTVTFNLQCQAAWPAPVSSPPADPTCQLWQMA